VVHRVTTGFLIVNYKAKSSVVCHYVSQNVSVVSDIIEKYGFFRLTGKKKIFLTVIKISEVCRSG